MNLDYQIKPEGDGYVILDSKLQLPSQIVCTTPRLCTALTLAALLNKHRNSQAETRVSSDTRSRA